MAEDVNALLRRHDRLKAQRLNSVENVWRDCYDLTFPLRGNGLSGATETANSAQSKQAQILDGTAADAANTLASNIMAGLTPANARWFALDVGNETAEERAWLDDSAQLLWENIHLGNFDAEGFESALDMVVAGQFAMYIDEDRDEGGLVFQHWALADCYFGSTRADGRIDIVHRQYVLTAEQAEREFGRNNLPQDIIRALEKRPGEEFQFLHAIYPRTPHAVSARLAKNLPFASCHIAIESKMAVRESGYHEFPVVVPRWVRVPRSHYGVGQVYAALPDIRQLNELKGFELAGADVAIAGMWLGIDDGVLNPTTVTLGPRKIVIAADKDSLSPLQTGANFQLSDVMVSKLQASIRKSLMADQLQPQDGPQMTAEEVRTRVDMIRKLLGPVYGRLQAEYIKPMIDRCFGLAFRAGIFKPAPQSLRGRSFSVRYVSPMARAQKLDEVAAIQQVFAAAAQLAPLEPGIMDELDPVKALGHFIEGLGAPESIRRDPEGVKQLREAKAKAAQQVQQQQIAQQAQAAGMEEAAKAAGAAVAA